jgi:chemotaxis receptor (MCP) glutamine deamidase CheD
MDAAVSALEARRVFITRTDMGGDRGRKIIFDPHTAQVSLIRLRPGFAGI